MNPQPHTKPGASMPQPSPTTPYWRSEKHQLDNHRSTSDLPHEQDIVIIGAGFAGAACAYYICQQPAPLPRTTVLEAREACSGATARNGGHLRPDSLATFQKFTPAFGINAARDMAQFELDNCQAVRSLIETEKIPCDYTEIMSSSVFLDESQAQETKQLLGNLVAQGHDILRRFKHYEGQEAEAVSGVKRAKGLVTFKAAHVWPYKLVMRLLSIATAKGVNLQTNTSVLGIAPQPDANGFWTLTTPRGELRAKKVIFATNGYTSHLLPRYGRSIVPVRGICSHITSLGDAPPISKTLRTMAINYGPGRQDYLVSRRDGGIIVGGAWNVVRPGPRGDWYNNTDDSRLIPIEKDYFTGLMGRTFESWEKTESQVDYLWTGIMGYTSDELPHVGTVEGMPGQYICAGFNGHGMPQVLLCAKGVVKMALEGCRFAETGVPSLFETSADRAASGEGEE